MERLHDFSQSVPKEVSGRWAAVTTGAGGGGGDIHVLYSSILLSAELRPRSLAAISKRWTFSGFRTFRVSKMETRSLKSLMWLATRLELMSAVKQVTRDLISSCESPARWISSRSLIRVLYLLNISAAGIMMQWAKGMDCDWKEMFTTKLTHRLGKPVKKPWKVPSFFLSNAARLSMPLVRKVTAINKH